MESGETSSGQDRIKEMPPWDEKGAWPSGTQDNFVPPGKDSHRSFELKLLVLL